jgi:hypothetical protein
VTEWLPRNIRFVAHFSMTLTGKIQKFRIRDAMKEQLGLAENRTAQFMNSPCAALRLPPTGNPAAGPAKPVPRRAPSSVACDR